MSDDVDPLCSLKERVAALAAGLRVGIVSARIGRWPRPDPVPSQRDYDGRYGMRSFRAASSWISGGMSRASTSMPLT
jgi:hypothetical protein